MLSARLILVRHGQSTYNAQARLQGQADPPLSDAGRAEAELLRPALAALRRRPRRHERPRRAQRDRRAARLPGRAPRPALARDRRRRVGRGARSRTSRRDRSRRGAAARCKAARRRVVGRPPGARRRRRSTSWSRPAGTWLVVCHGGVVRAALSHVTGADPQRVAGPANASVTVVRAAGPPQLESYGWAAGAVSALTRDEIHRKFSARAALQPVTPPSHPGAFAEGGDKGGNRPAGKWGRRAGRLPHSTARAPERARRPPAARC